MSWVGVTPEAARKSDCLGCAVLLCHVCLFDLAGFFLSSFSSLIIALRSARVVVPSSCKQEVVGSSPTGRAEFFSESFLSTCYLSSTSF